MGRPRAGLSASGSNCMRGLQDGPQPNLDKDKYKEPKFIAAGVLKRAMRELNERADLTFRYEPIKETRKLVGWVLGPFPIRRQLRYQPEQRRLNARANCANFRHTSGLLTKRAGEMDECHSGKP
jgi:hypothetical protein